MDILIVCIFCWNEDCSYQFLCISFCVNICFHFSRVQENMFSILKNCQVLFQRDCATDHSHHQGRRGPAPPQPHQHLSLSFLFDGRHCGGVKCSSPWFSLAFPWKVMWLIIFSCAFWTFGDLLGCPGFQVHRVQCTSPQSWRGLWLLTQKGTRQESLILPCFVFFLLAGVPETCRILYEVQFILQNDCIPEIFPVKQMIIILLYHWLSLLNWKLIGIKL